MCGVIGYFSERPYEYHRHMVAALFTASKIRGLHAFGFQAIDVLGDMEMAKAHELPELLQKIERLDPLPQMLIGHNRYSTSGDWQDHVNNQPIWFGESALVFNGVISMKSKAEYEAEFGKQYDTANDGEIMLRKIIDGEEWERWVRDGSFSYAGLHFHDGEGWAIRNENRPLWFWKMPGERTVFFASTVDIFRRTPFWRKDFDAQPLPAGQAFRFRELV